MLSNNPQPIKITTNLKELYAFADYVNFCLKHKHLYNEYFTEGTKFFIIWHLEEFKAKIVRKLFISETNFVHAATHKTLKITLSLAEQKSFSYLFKNFEPNEALVYVMQQKFLNGLVNTWTNE